VKFSTSLNKCQDGKQNINIFSTAPSWDLEDVIKFCNETLAAFNSQAADLRGKSLSNRELNIARSEYSKYFLSELDDEIFKHMPHYEAYIEVMKSLDSLHFTKQDFERACAARAGVLPKNYDPAKMLAQLFDFSLVAYYMPGGGGYGGAEYIWRYKDSRARFNEASTSFRIHPGLKEILGLKKFSRADASYEAATLQQTSLPLDTLPSKASED
jgi:hypothetical protein